MVLYPDQAIMVLPLSESQLRARQLHRVSSRDLKYTALLNSRNLKFQQQRVTVQWLLISDLEFG